MVLVKAEVAVEMNKIAADRVAAEIDKIVDPAAAVAPFEVAAVGTVVAEDVDADGG